MNQTHLLRGYKLADIAAACGVHFSAVSYWLRRNQVPAIHCLAIERFTSGQITRYELRPDVFGQQEPGAA